MIVLKQLDITTTHEITVMMKILQNIAARIPLLNENAVVDCVDGILKLVEKLSENPAFEG